MKATKILQFSFRFNQSTSFKFWKFYKKYYCRNSHIEQFACFNGPSAWSIIPDETKQDLLMPSLSDRSAAISAMTDAAATAAAVASCGSSILN